MYKLEFSTVLYVSIRLTDGHWNKCIYPGSGRDGLMVMQRV